MKKQKIDPLIKLGLAITSPVELIVDKKSLARKVLFVDDLKAHELPIYDIAPEQRAIVAKSKEGKVGHRVKVPDFEIVSRMTVSTNILANNKVANRIADKICKKENELLVDLLSVSAKDSKQSVSGKGTKFALAEGFSTIKKHKLDVSKIIANSETIKRLKEEGGCHFDEALHPEVLDSGLYANFWGADVLCTDLLPKNVMYVCTEPKYLGVMPVRLSISTIFDVSTSKLKLVTHEIIGMAVINTKGVCKVVVK
jgi:hypothetical protein